jgi:hypothetical protein
MSFLSVFKAVSAQLNKAAKTLDDKIDTFASSVSDEIISSFDLDDEHKNEIIEIIKGKFSILFENEKRKTSNGFMVFCNEKRKEVSELEKEKNPNIKPTEISKVLGAMWKELSQEDRNHYNSIASDKKDKPEEKKEPVKEVKEVCQFDGCTKVLKNKVEHEGKFYCAIHYKKAITDDKKSKVIKCNHVKKDGVKCTANAIDGNWCGKHLKKTPRENMSGREVVSDTDRSHESNEKKEPIKYDEGVNELPVKDINDEENDDFWVFKRIKIEGEKCRLHQLSNIVLHITENVFLGYNEDGEFMSNLNDIKPHIIEWVKKCGIELKN